MPDSPKQKTPPKMSAVTLPDPVEVLAAGGPGVESRFLTPASHHADAAVVELARAVLALRLEVADLKRGPDDTNP